jgi:uncharacterized protein YfaS (alpha-2-macroglobulin family)
MKRVIRCIVAFCLILFPFCITSCAKKTGRSASITAFSGSFVERGRPIADLATYRIAYYEPVDDENTFIGGTVQESDEPFVITDYGPRDTIPKEIKKPSIYVFFSQPVVPLAKLGDPIREGAELFSIEPPLAGVYRWYGSKLLSFEPDTENLPQQRYTITVSEGITSLGGKNLEGERSFSFETERLSVLDWQLGMGDSRVLPGNVNPEEGRYIRLIFSYPVNLEEIARWIELRATDKIWPFTLERLPKIDEKRYRKEQGVLLRINEKLPLDTDVVLVLKAGARSEPSWLGSKEDKTWTYHTLLPFRFKELSVQNYSRPWSEVGDAIHFYLEFNQDVEPDEAEKYFSVDSFPALKKENVDVHGSTVVINRLPLQYERNYTIRISADLKDTYGRTLGRAERVEAKVGEASSYVSIRSRGSRMLEASYPPKIIWEAQNPVSLRSFYTVAQSPYERLPLQNLESIDVSRLQKNTRRYFIEDLSPLLNAAGKGSVTFRWEYQTKSSWRSDTIDTNNAWLTVQVTNIGITVRYAYNMALVWATHLSDGTAAANADVELLDGERIILRGKTDAQGLAVFQFTGDELANRFTAPQTRNEAAIGGLRIRVSEGRGNSIDRAEFIPDDSDNLWPFYMEAGVSPFTAGRERPVTLLFTDRGLYRPGETVNFRGIDRNLHQGNYEAYQGPYHIEVSGRAAPVIVSLQGEATVNGGSFGSFTLPANINPGQYRIVYRRGGTEVSDNGREIQASVSFTVANYERLRFESSLRFPDTVVYRGEQLNATLSASYLSGGGLSDAPYTWYLTRESATFIPGGADGVWRNWRFGPEPDIERVFVEQGEGALGSDGKAAINYEATGDGIEGAAYRYRIEAAVQDAARQELSSRASVLVHPASFYIAARLDSGRLESAAVLGGTGERTRFAAANPSASFINAGNPASLSWALVAPNGDTPESSAVTKDAELSIQLVRHEWKQIRQEGIGGRVNLVWERVEEIVEQSNVKIETAKAGEYISGVYNFTPDTGGLWELRLRSKDNKQRVAATSFRFYVSGAGWVRWDVDAINLTTDRQSYAPGETAKILVRSPLEKGRYLLTLEREGIISRQIIQLDGSALTIDIPIRDSYIPIIYATLSSYTVRSGPPQNSYYEADKDKPKGVFGVTPIYVDHESRHYQVEIAANKSNYRPAEEAEMTVKVLLNGRPAPDTEVIFLAVDRGVVDLIDYHVPDPVSFFYSSRNFPLGVRGADSRSLLIDPVTYAISDIQGGAGIDETIAESMRSRLSFAGVGFNGAVSEMADGSEMAERRDFRPTAVFEPFLVTGPDGTVTVKFKLPDSLTTFRCTAAAVGRNNFGMKEQDLQVSAPLTAVVALPRKLRWRDTGTASLILTNLENNTVEANVALEITPNIIEVDGAKSKTVKIPPRMSQEVTFKVAALGIGEAELAFTLRSPRGGAVNERIIRTILVDRPSLIETVTTIGNLPSGDGAIEEGMVLPSLIPEGTGSVLVSLSVSRLATLMEAIHYLLDNTYDSIEQRTSRLLPLIVFGNHPDSIGNSRKIVEDELAAIVKLQLGDGSFPYWPGTRYGDVFVSLRVAHIAVLAKAKGISVPDSLDTQRLLSFVTAATSDSNAPVMYRYLSTDPFIKGYSLWIRTMYGERIGSEISAFLRQGDELGISGWAFAGLAALEMGQKDLAASTQDRVRRFIRPGTQSLDLTDTVERMTIDPRFTRRPGNYWGFDTDRYAISLMLFHLLTPEDELTTRLATTLVERQRGGVWKNTASSFWALLAFSILGDSESAEWKIDPDDITASLKSTVTLGGTALFDAEFKTYGSAPISYSGSFAENPIDGLPRDTLLPLRIERTGPGRLYYTASLRYGIPVELAGARDEGLGVFVETFDSDGQAVNGGRFKPGKTYTRRITISSSRDRSFVALRAPIPSGAEIIDTVFVTSSTVPPPEENPLLAERVGEARYYYQPQPERFIKDDEVRFHWDFFKAGRQQVEFRFRAVMPGIYPTPPASAECMYEAEIFGRASGELIRIE